MAVSEARAARNERERALRGRGRDVFTTGQLARLCRVAPRTVAKWIDVGLLRGYRVPTLPRPDYVPKSAAGAFTHAGDRRVRREVLVEFLRRHGMCEELREIGEGPGALVVGDSSLAESLAPLVRDVVCADDLFAAGALTQEHSPAVVVLCGTLGRAEVRAACASLARRPWSPVSVVLAPEDWPQESWQSLGATHVLQRPVAAERLAKLLGHE